MIKITAILIVLYTLVGFAAGYFHFGQSWALSFLLGGLAMLLNLLGLAFFWRLILSKKSIALAALVIIFKYLILGMILWSLTSVKSLQPIGFVMGLASLLFALVVLLTREGARKSMSKKN